MEPAIIAASRFGLGAGGPGFVSGADPQSWLTRQLARPDRPAALAGLPDAASSVVQEQQFRQAQQKARKAGEQKDMAAAMQEREEAKAAYLREVDARYLAAVTSETPFVERLVAFWANHFTVSGIRPVVRPIAGAFEREAIRPHVTGRFEDMVLAVVRHPAMGLYLDNAVSVGPNSKVGLRGKRGVNENLGRELLELHTLGVDGGYGEQDVRSLARILTGWSIARLNDPNPGHFHFYEPIHEPGAQVLLARTYDQDGMAQGEAAIRDLCRHPATARHIARKLAAHFIADTPSPEAVETLVGSFRDSGGDLRQVSLALATLPEAGSAPFGKVKTPWELVVSASIATGVRLTPDQVSGMVDHLGQPVFMAPQPSGWPDDSASWVAPEAVLRRVAWCASFAERADRTLDPASVGDRLFGSDLDPATREAMARAESRPMALAMLLASPQFQRR